MNLCTNALQAMKSAGALIVSLDLLTLKQSRTLATATLSAGEYIRLLVRILGVGIVGVLERIFEPFFTTKEVVRVPARAFARAPIVSDLGGAVDVESEPDRGSAFTVLLPCHGRASQVFPAVEEPPWRPGKPFCRRRPGAACTRRRREDASMRLHAKATSR